MAFTGLCVHESNGVLRGSKFPYTLSLFPLDTYTYTYNQVLIESIKINIIFMHTFISNRETYRISLVEFCLSLALSEHCL